MQQLKRLILTTFVFYLISISLVAQGRYVPGHIITLTNDSVKGWIQLQDNVDLSKGCVFKSSLEGKAQKYNVKDLMGFQFDNEHRTFYKRTVVHRNQSRVVFLETVVSGKLELLNWVDIYSEDVIYLSKSGDTTLIPLPFQQMEVYQDDGYTRKRKMITTVMHMDTLRKYMADRPDLFTRVDKMTKPELKALTSLISEYDNIPTLITEKEQKVLSKNPFSIHIMPGMSTSNYKLLGPLIFDCYVGGSVSLHMFGRYDQVLLTAGAYKRIVEGNPVYQENHFLVRVPISLDYCYRGKVFNPFIGVGFNGYLDNTGTNWIFSPTLGFKINFTKRCALVYRLMWDLDAMRWDHNTGIYKYIAHTGGLEFNF